MRLILLALTIGAFFLFHFLGRIRISLEECVESALALVVGKSLSKKASAWNPVSTEHPGASGPSAQGVIQKPFP